jgi:hypothetical protein
VARLARNPRTTSPWVTPYDATLTALWGSLVHESPFLARRLGHVSRWEVMLALLRRVVEVAGSPLEGAVLWVPL